MKRKMGLFFVTVILAIAMLSQVVVLADWEPYYQQQYASVYATRLTKTYNEVGQTVYTAYNSYGSVVLDVRARNGNIWNNTTQVLLTETNKGPECVGISAELDVYGINTLGNPMMYRNGFQSGEVPYVDKTIYATSIMTDSNGIAIGVYTTNGGGYSFQNGNNSNNCVNGNNEYDYGSYPKVVQNPNNNQCYYYVSSNRYCTYALTGSKLTCKDYNGFTSSMSGISEIMFGQGYIAAVTTSNKVNIIEVGRKIEVKKYYNDYFVEWIYQNSNSYWVIGYKDSKGNNHYFSDNYDDYYGKYPHANQDGNQYTYYANSNISYTYTLSSSGRLSHNSTTIANNVEQVEFAEGYLVYVDNELNVYKVRVGTTSEAKVCSNFREFYYDDYTGLVYEVRNSSRSYDL